MKENKLLSIVIPVYNSEKYLVDCLDTIISQSYENIEIIIIDDGSTDNSRTIINEYIKKDKRIKGFFNENSGVSAARNFGIEQSNGDYITFVDSDDWIDLDMYCEMIGKLEGNDCDIVLCSFVREVNSKINTKEILPFKSEEKLEGEDIFNDLILNLIAYEDETKESIMGSSWRCIFKVDIIKDNHIFFDRTMSFGEDLIFCLNTFKKSKSIYILNKPFYHYRFTETSVTSQYKSNHFLRQLLIYDKIKEIFVDYNNQELNNRMNIMMLRYIINGITHICNVDNSFLDKYKLTKDILNNEKSKNLRNTYKIRSKKYKILQYNLPLLIFLLINLINKRSKKIIEVEG